MGSTSSKANKSAGSLMRLNIRLIAPSRRLAVILDQSPEHGVLRHDQRAFIRLEQAQVAAFREVMVLAAREFGRGSSSWGLRIPRTQDQVQQLRGVQGLRRAHDHRDRWLRSLRRLDDDQDLFDVDRVDSQFLDAGG